MEIKKIPEKNHTIRAMYGVPVTEETKALLDQIKRDNRIDVNGMTRDFFNVLLKETIGHEAAQN